MTRSIDDSLPKMPDAPATTSSAVGWQDAGADGGPLYVITLLSSNTPMPLQVPKAVEFESLAVFRSRRIEDGRERFRLHIGYFPSAAAAEALLPLVRDRYPTAFAAVAPQTGMGSLEDTSVARFSILKAAGPAPRPRAPASTPVAAVGAAGGPSVEGQLHPPVEPPVLSAAEIVVPSGTRASPPPVLSSVTDERLAQRYAVQLLWVPQAIDLAVLPNLAIFGGYLLYAVETEPGGRRMFGVRLGFYEDALSARLVAQYVRSEFKGVAVVPVSDREVLRASAAVIRLPGSRAGRTAMPSRVRWPQSAVPVQYTSLRAPSSPVI